jgi:ABC-2 type transport system ATP-binding protein
MIRLDQVQKWFGRVHAVRGISLEIPKGQVVGVLGPNGAGKTTTIRMIAAAIPPTTGGVTVGGHDGVADSMAVRRLTGYLPESAPLYREMRVGSFLRYRAGLFGLAGKARAAAVSRAVSQCQLADVLGRRCGQLSKGYRQRVGLASVLLHDPEVLILDEPTSGLDPVQIAETRGLIRGLAGTRTMLIVSHILPEVERSCDRILLVSKGRVQADGAPDRLIEALPDARTYVVEARGERGASAGDPLDGLPGSVRTIAADVGGGWRRWEIEFEAGAGDRREAIARAAAAGGLLVRELRPRAATLEEVYRRFVAGEPEKEAP